MTGSNAFQVNADGQLDAQQVTAAVVAVHVSGLREPERRSERTLLGAMEDHAAIICERTPLRVLRLPMIDADTSRVVASIVGLGERIPAVVLLGLSAEDSATVRREVRDHGGPAVVSELDCVAVALTAEAVARLRWCGVPPRTGSVVITGMSALPVLAPLLMASGVGDISLWNTDDAQSFPLRRLMEHNDVLVDLCGASSSDIPANRVVAWTGSNPFPLAATVIPGLISALCGHRVPELTVDMLVAAVRALVLITPAGEVLPGLDHGLLVSTVALHVSRVLEGSHRSLPA